MGIVYKHHNSASRLHSVFRVAAKQNTNEATHKVWATALGIAPSDRQLAEVAEALAWIGLEIDILEAQLKLKGVSTYLWESSIARLRSAISMQHLEGSWQTFSKHLQPDTVALLGAYVEMLPSDEEPLPDDVLPRIKELVSKLKSAVEDEGDLPEDLRALARKHVTLLERVLAQYPVHGARVLREVAKVAMVDAAIEKDALQAHSESQTVSTLDKAWRGVNAAIEVALKGDKLLALGERITKLLEQSGMV